MRALESLLLAGWLNLLESMYDFMYVWCMSTYFAQFKLDYLSFHYQYTEILYIFWIWTLLISDVINISFHSVDFIFILLMMPLGRQELGS